MFLLVLVQCALIHDLAEMREGDQTIIRDGTNLSGGQRVSLATYSLVFVLTRLGLQSRILLARAVYSRAAILLLDGILESLDNHTVSWIVDHCLGGDLMKGRTVLLTVHNGKQLLSCIWLMLYRHIISKHSRTLSALSESTRVDGYRSLINPPSPT